MPGKKLSVTPQNEFDIPYRIVFANAPAPRANVSTRNFCSPNCVKAYCMASKTFDKKTYIIGQFYRKLFGRDFAIKPAPSICLLKDYGGSLTIEEFRKSFYSNKRYTLNNINSKVIYIN